MESRALSGELDRRFTIAAVLITDSPIPKLGHPHPRLNRASNLSSVEAGLKMVGRSA